MKNRHKTTYLSDCKISSTSHGFGKTCQCLRVYACVCGVLEYKSKKYASNCTIKPPSRFEVPRHFEPYEVYNKPFWSKEASSTKMPANWQRISLILVDLPKN